MLTIQALLDRGNDAVHVRQYGMARASDRVIFARATEEQRIVLTFDLDFGEILAATGSHAPSVIIFRLQNQTPASVNPKLMEILNACEYELRNGSIIVVSDDRFRVRKLPIHGA